MAPLKNPRWEAYAVELSKPGGASQAERYVMAGFSPNEGRASELANKSLISERTQELKDAIATKLVEKTGITLEKVINELAKIGFSNMDDYISRTSAGDPFVDLSNTTRDQMAAVQEVVIDDYVEGRGDDARDVKRIRLKLAEKRTALVDIGRHLGLKTGNDGSIVNNTINNLQVGLDERRALESFLVGLSRRRGDPEVVGSADPSPDARAALELEVQSSPKTNGSKG